ADIFAYAPFPDGGAHDICVLEAMSSGLPVVVTDVSSVNESVTHLKDGILVPFDDAEGFSAAVERLIVDESLRREMGHGARRTAEELFSLLRLRANYLLAYDDALRAPPPSPADDMRRSVRAFVAERMRIARFEQNLVLLHDTLEATAIAGRYWVVGGMLL